MLNQLHGIPKGCRQHAQSQDETDYYSGLAVAGHKAWRTLCRSELENYPDEFHSDLRYFGSNAVDGVFSAHIL